MEVVDYQNKGIFLVYLWCTAGDSGPYQAPVDVYSEKNVQDGRGYFLDNDRFGYV